MVIAAAEAHVYEPQYKGLGELHDKYNGQGFEVLAFPCEFHDVCRLSMYQLINPVNQPACK